MFSLPFTSTSTIPYYFYYLEVRMEAFANLLFHGNIENGPSQPTPIFQSILFYFPTVELKRFLIPLPPSLPPSSQNKKTSTQSHHLLLKITKHPTREKLQDRQGSLLLHVPALRSPLISFFCFIFSFAFVVVVFGELCGFLLLNLYYFALINNFWIQFCVLLCSLMVEINTFFWIWTFIACNGGCHQ